MARASCPRRTWQWTRNPSPNRDGPLTPVLYGYPSPDMFESEMRGGGEIVLGGCTLVHGVSELEACRQCGYRTIWSSQALVELWSQGGHKETD